MKEFGKEIIEIDGKEYTLFLNRKGILTWEKITNAINKATEIEKKYDNLESVDISQEVEIKEGDNPFDLADNITSEFEEDTEQMITMYKKLYWIMLYEEHKLDYKDVEVLWDKAVEEYGVDQLVELAFQMIEDANTNKTANLKNLKALRPKKNN